MPFQFQLTLTAAAKKAGGDKYKIIDCWTDRERFLYVPQNISRIDGQPVGTLHCTVGDSGIPFNLVKEAKGSGDDRYSPNNGTWTGDIYLPKEVRAPQIQLNICK